MVIPPVGGDAARDAARRELQRGEYHRDDPGIAERAVRWLGRRLDALLDGGLGSHGVLLLAAVLVTVAVVLAVRAGAPARRAARVPPSSPLDPLAATSSRDHRAAAERYSAGGRQADALREWLRAAVATIEERGVLPPRPGRTGAATAREAGPALPAAAADLAAGVAAFEQVWFGGRRATDADVTLARRAADAVAASRVLAADLPPVTTVPPW